MLHKLPLPGWKTFDDVEDEVVRNWWDEDPQRRKKHHMTLFGISFVDGENKSQEWLSDLSEWIWTPLYGKVFVFGSLCLAQASGPVGSQDLNFISSPRGFQHLPTS